MILGSLVKAKTKSNPNREKIAPKRFHIFPGVILFIDINPLKMIVVFFNGIFFVLLEGKMIHFQRCRTPFQLKDTLRQSNIAMEHGPFEDVFPIKNI